MTCFLYKIPDTATLIIKCTHALNSQNQVELVGMGTILCCCEKYWVSKANWDAVALEHACYLSPLPATHILTA